MMIERLSPDVITGVVLKQELFNISIISCTAYLYQLMYSKIMRVKNIDLL